MMKRTLAITALTCTLAPFAQAEEVNIYSFRQEFLIKPLLDAFTEETGIRVNVVFAKNGLLERIEHEGQNTPADLLLTADVGPLYDAAQRGLLAPLTSDVIEHNVPAHYRDPDNLWVGLTTRARIIYAAKGRVEPNEIQRYEDLTDPKWKGRICTRSGKHTYNLSLIGSMIALHGEAEAEAWLEGVKANLARKPQGNDRAQIKAVAQGVCDLALGNSYYFGGMIANDKDPQQREWAEAVNPIFPNQADRGAHTNISGAGLTKYAPHPEAALKLVEYLTQEHAQNLYAQTNFEFPVRPGTPWSPILEKYMGGAKMDDLSLKSIAEHRAEAAKLVDKTGFDN